jgi:hypothetical protein
MLSQVGFPPFLGLKSREPRQTTGFKILIRDRLDNVPAIVKHLKVAAAVAHALLSIIERVLPAILAAVNRANAFGFKNFPAASFLPSRIAGQCGLE